MGFDKKNFAILLEKAKGRRSINAYAQACDISAAHISRFLRELIETAPSPQTIKKLSDNAYNSVTYTDMMQVCGHTKVSKDEINTPAVLNALKQELKLATDAMQEESTSINIGICQGLLRAIEVLNKVTGEE